MSVDPTQIMDEVFWPTCCSKHPCARSPRSNYKPAGNVKTECHGVPNTRSALICPPVGNLRFRFIPGIFGRMFLLWSAYLFCTDVACPTLLRSGPEVSLLGHADLASVHHTLSLSDSSRPLKSASGSSAFLVLSDSCALLMLTNWLSSSTMLLSHVVCHVQSIGDQLQGHAAS